ncbi:S-adenosyl-L-methionine-dependent methyltransferase, partial [Ochromonadaceae sp. CCMP2298]
RREVKSPLAMDLISYIKLRGPITLHDYMAQCANHLIHGYYQSRGELIGPEGDFVTAPEVSQLFGEMVGIWCLSMWRQMGSPRSLNLVELGPGKGTLMADVLRVAGRFPDFNGAVRVHLVELSAELRKRQRTLL